MYNIPDYSFVHNSRRHKSGGGVGIYVKNNISFIDRVDLRLSETLCESIFIEIPQTDGKNIVVGVIYKPPDVNISQFTEAFDTIISKLVYWKINIFILWVIIT